MQSTIVKDGRIRPPGNRISEWRVTAQPNRSRPAHCHRCKETFVTDECRIRAVRESEKLSGKVANDRLMHVGCADAEFPLPCRFAGYDELPGEVQKAFGDQIYTIRGELGAVRDAKRAKMLTAKPKDDEAKVEAAAGAPKEAKQDKEGDEVMEESPQAASRTAPLRRALVPVARRTGQAALARQRAAPRYR